MTHHEHDATSPATRPDAGHGAGAAREPEDDVPVEDVPADDPATAAAEHAADEVAASDEDPTAEPDGAEPPTEPEDPMAVLARERDEYLDALRRKQAEFENFRKRMMRDGAAQRIAGHAEVAERMLDVLDDFDRTIEAAGEVDPGLLKGVQLVHDKLARVLADFGLTRIDEAEVIFDPNRHEAVQQVSDDEDLDEPVVAQVLRPGYELGGRTLRAAMVAVRQ